MEVVIAAFDVDNTLTVRDCVVPFMRRTVGTWGMAKASLTSPITLLKMFVRRDRDAIKAHFVSNVFTGKSVDVVEEDGVAFAAVVSEKWIRGDVAQRMRWHQEQGHVVVLVSASLDAYLTAFGDMCEVDAVLCTRLEVKDGRYTGQIEGANCRGDEKLRRLQEWMRSAGLESSKLDFAYGDSSGDDALLAAAQTGILVKKTELIEVSA